MENKDVIIVGTLCFIGGMFFSGKSLGTKALILSVGIGIIKGIEKANSVHCYQLISSHQVE